MSRFFINLYPVILEKTPNNLALEMAPDLNNNLIKKHNCFGGGDMARIFA